MKKHVLHGIDHAAFLVHFYCPRVSPCMIHGCMYAHHEDAGDPITLLYVQYYFFEPKVAQHHMMMRNSRAEISMSGTAYRMAVSRNRYMRGLMKKERAPHRRCFFLFFGIQDTYRGTMLWGTSMRRCWRAWERCRFRHAAFCCAIAVSRIALPAKFLLNFTIKTSIF
jgi:hypothetical protein